MTTPTREMYAEVLSARVKTEVLDACTTCGKCAEACPMILPAGIRAGSVDLVKGVLATLANEPSSQESARWIEACSSSGTCISACEYGVDPMFMIEMARVSLLNSRGPKQVQANGTRAFQRMAKSVRYLSRLFLEPDVFERLSPKSGRQPDDPAPNIIFYTGCNVLRTPHIALICLDILDALGMQYEVMGGPSHCCGSYQMKEGDIGAASNMATNTIGKMVKAAVPEVISWCPSCQLQFGTNHLPTYTAASGGKSPFDFVPFYKFLEQRIDDLAPRMQGRVEKTVMLDERAFDPEVNAAVRRILRLIPGLTIVEGNAQHVGMMRNMIPLQSVKNSSRNEAFDAATQAGVTTLATIYHACHREIVGYSDTVSFEIVNAIELIADCLGISYHDSFKEFQLVSDIDRFIDERMDLVSAHGLPVVELRAVAQKEREAHRPV
jgi:heterodisulfide reductase subunit D